MSPVLFPRQNNNQDGNVDGNVNGDGEEVFVNNHNWWFSPTAVIVKWSILGAIVLFFLVWFVGGHFHAKRRIKKGLPPLRYHAFLVPDRYRPQRPMPQNHAYFYRMENNGYTMEAMPPTYGQSGPLPPTYQGDNKTPQIDPNQSYDMPPPGEPPSEPPSELPPRDPKKAGGIMKKINPFSK